MKSNSFLAIIGSLYASIALTHATVVIDIGAGRLNDHNGNAISNTALLQLINLGADGVFNPISLADGNTSGLNQWVSGDDTVFDVALIGSDYPSTKAFDLVSGNAGTGTLSRLFTFDLSSLPGDVKLGLRWFPGLQASNFNSITLTNGERYGQFTRQSNPLNGGSVWVTPTADGNFTFDALITQHVGGVGYENNALGNASLTVPEPGTASLAVMGIAMLCGIRRRQS